MLSVLRTIAQNATQVFLLNVKNAVGATQLHLWENACTPLFKIAKHKQTMNAKHAKMDFIFKIMLVFLASLKDVFDVMFKIMDFQTAHTVFQVTQSYFSMKMMLTLDTFVKEMDKKECLKKKRKMLASLETDLQGNA